MTIGYVVNRYPHASHSFIRREICALERHAAKVERISIRPVDGGVVDPNDQAECGKTHVLLNHLSRFVLGTLLWIIGHPLRAYRALHLAMSIGFQTGTLVKSLIYCGEGLGLAHLAKRRNISHIHAHFGTNPAAIVMFCYLAGGPGYSVTMHGPEEFDSPQRLALAEKIRHARFLVAISEFGRSQMYRWCQFQDWKKIHVVHCGVDSQFLETPTPSVSDSNKMVCIGRLCEQKGQLLLVEAASVLAQEQVNFELVLVGDGPMRREVQDLIIKLKLQSHVTITGWQTNEQVRQHILSSRVMVLASFAEGLPVALMEAFALRRPVISTQIAGIPELVQPGVSGWLIPPGSVADLVEAMRTALMTPREELARMGDAGRARVQKHFNAESEAEKLAQLFALLTIPDHQMRHSSAVKLALMETGKACVPLPER